MKNYWEIQNLETTESSENLLNVTSDIDCGNYKVDNSTLR